MGVFERLIDRGFLPDDILAGQFRSRALMMARQLREGGTKGVARRTDEHLEQLAKGPLVAPEAGLLHPEGAAPPALHGHLLGPAALTGPWFADSDELRQEPAEQAALELIVQRARIADGDSILDLGGGLGGTALHLAARFRQSKVITRCANASIAAYVNRQARQRGLLNLEVRTGPLSRFDPGVTFERLVAVEGTARWLDHKRLLERMSAWTTPGGTLLLQLPSHSDVPHMLPMEPMAWLGADLLKACHVTTLDVLAGQLGSWLLDAWWAMPGTYMARTLQGQLENMETREVSVMEQLRKLKGDDAPIWRRRWRAGLMAMQELHLMADGDEWGHHQILLEQP